MPSTGDQFDNGKRAQRRGCGTMIKTGDFTAERYEQELTEMTNNLSALRQKCMAARDRLQLDGLEKCADAVERFLDKAS